ncbi:MAG: hypothetical protein WD492_13805 [Alkalispirochaeta sp.]
MKRILLMGILALIFSVASVSADHVPSTPADGFEIQGHSRFFLYRDDLSTMVEYAGRFEDPGLGYRSLTLGGYYRLHKNVKAGAFYRLQSGAQHDDDWVTTNPGWEWTDTSERLEHVAMFDLTPRFLLDFLPGGNWVFAVKSRYEYNFFDGQQVLFVRPGLTWFWIVDRRPVMNVSAQYATYFSLNFGDKVWYRHGPYLNLLYHVLPWLQLDASVAYQAAYWSESADFRDSHPNESYANNVDRSWILDLGVIVTLRS